MIRNVCLLICLWTAPVSLLADDANWRNIPLIENGAIASEWKLVGWGTMEVDGEALVTRPDERGMGLLVWTKQKLGNCQIRVVYRPENAQSNAGVYVRVDDGIRKWIDKPSLAVSRDAEGGLSPEMLAKMQAASEAEEGPWYAVHHGYEVQLCDTGDPLHRTGSIYSLAATRFEPPAAPSDRWRTLVITLDGDQIHVEQDGQRITTFDASASQVPAEREWYEPKREPRRPRSGYVGLQVHDPGDTVWFREVSVRPLIE